jgi:hypothetical protein
LRPEAHWNAEVVEAVNTVLDRTHSDPEYARLIEEIEHDLQRH